MGRNRFRTVNPIAVCRLLAAALFAEKSRSSFRAAAFLCRVIHGFGQAQHRRLLCRRQANPAIKSFSRPLRRLLADLFFSNEKSRRRPFVKQKIDSNPLPFVPGKGVASALFPIYNRIGQKERCHETGLFLADGRFGGSPCAARGIRRIGRFGRNAELTCPARYILYL